MSEITLGQYQRYFKFQNEQQDDNLLATKMVEIFCRLSHKDVMSMQLTDVFSITGIISEMFDTKPTLVRKFKMDGVTFGFIPNLDKISFGEYIDLDLYLGDWENIHKAMAVLYRPIQNSYGNKYNIIPYEPEGQEAMSNMPMDAVMSSVIFFYHLGIDLSQTMVNYLMEQEESNLVQYLSSLPNGVGTPQFTTSLKGILEGLKISLN